MLALNCLLTVAWWFNESDNESSQYVICRNHIWFHLADLLFEVSFIIIAFVKERFHNAVEIDILGIFEGYSSLQIWPLPKKFFRGEIIQGEWRNFHRARALFLTGVEFHVLPCVLVWLSSLTFSSRLVCFLWTVLPCLFMFTNTKY